MNTEHTKHPCEAVDASTDVMKLAEMILSDCGCSTAISDSLQRRVGGRIQQHMDSALGGQQQAEPVAYPPYSVFSNSDGDSWEEHPASDCFVHGKKLGEEFELLAGWQAERVTFRVTKVPDDESDDYEVEEVNPAPVAIKKPVHVLVDALEKLARLGAGDRYGNSDGNRIAQQALATYRDYAAQPPAVAVAVPDGLRRRCVEILNWQKKGILEGDALRKYASEQWYAKEHNCLQLAETDTAREAFAMLAAAPQGVDSSVPVADEKECLHDFVMFRNECVKCGQPYDAAQKGGA